MKITVDLIDIVIDRVWSDDTGDFEINENIIGTYELVECTYKDNDVDKYIFEIAIEYLKEKTTKNYKYILNNLGGPNELYGLKNEDETVDKKLEDAAEEVNLLYKKRRFLIEKLDTLEILSENPETTAKVIVDVPNTKYTTMEFELDRDLVAHLLNITRKERENINSSLSKLLNLNG